MPKPQYCSYYCNGCAAELRLDVKARYDYALKVVRAVFAPMAQPLQYGKVAMLVRDDLLVSVQFLSGLKSPFEAEFLRYQEPRPFDPARPFTLIAATITQYELELLSLTDEQTLAMQFAASDGRGSLEISLLEY